VESLRLSPPVRAEPEGPPDPRDRRLAHPLGPRHRPCRAVRGFAGLTSEGRHDNRLDLVVADRAPGAGPGLVEAPPPSRRRQAHERCLAHPRLAGDIGGSPCPPHMPP